MNLSCNIQAAQPPTQNPLNPTFERGYYIFEDSIPDTSKDAAKSRKKTALRIPGHSN